MEKILLITAFTFLLLPPDLSCGATSENQYLKCLGGNYTLNSQYGKNLKLATAKMARELTSALFATEAVYGEGAVYGLMRCRGDITLSACRRCIGQALKDAQGSCKLRTGAMVYRELCSVGYYNQDLVSLLTDSSINRIVIARDSSEVVIRSQIFNDNNADLSYTVRQLAGITSTHFITGRKEVYTMDYRTTIYALGQCLPILSIADCDQCLSSLIDALGSHELTAGRASNLWCNYRFALYRFFSGEPMVTIPPDDIPHGEFYVSLT